MNTTSPTLRCATVFGLALAFGHASPAQHNWTQANSNVLFRARVEASIAYDLRRDRTVMFGGSDTGVGFANTTYEFDGTNWRLAYPQDRPRWRLGQEMVYDAARGECVMFSGETSSGFMADTWRYDGVNWVEAQPSVRPPARKYHAMTFDSHRDVVVMFGGQDGTNQLTDTWEWDGDSWTRRTPALHPSTSIGEMVYDAARRKTVFFGGTAPGHLTWEWDGSGWQSVTTTRSPGPREHVALAYDSALGRTVLFGGVRGRTILADTWVFDGSTWTQLTTSTTPGARAWAGTAFDIRRERITMVGGGVFDPRHPWRNGSQETWLFASPVASLSANVDTIAMGSGGTQRLAVDVGLRQAGRQYFIVGTVSGTLSGTRFGGLHLPIVADYYTELALSLAIGNLAPVSGFLGALDASGRARASLRVPGGTGLPSGFALHHSVFTFDAATGRTYTASRPVRLRLQ